MADISVSASKNPYRSISSKNFHNASDLFRKHFYVWTWIVKLRTELFLQNLLVENFQNVSELHSKHLHFLTCKLWKCIQNFFRKLCKRRTSKMRLNFTANSSVFRRMNHENAPRIFTCKPCKWRTSKMCLNFTENSFVFGCIHHENVPRTFCVKLASGICPKICMNFTAKSLVLGHMNHENVPRIFSCKPCKWRTSKPSQ